MNENLDEWGRSLSDGEPWKNVSTITDAAELTALWLEGKSTFYPNWLAPHPAEETQLIADHLVGLNRYGFWTTGSQPGVNEGGNGLRQRNYVTGFVSVDTYFQMKRALLGTDLVIISGGGGERTSIDVSMRNDFGFTFLGRFEDLDNTDYFLSLARNTNVEFASYVRDQALEVQIFDPVWGRNDVLLPSLIAVFMGFSMMRGEK